MTREPEPAQEPGERSKPGRHTRGRCVLVALSGLVLTAVAAVANPDAGPSSDWAFAVTLFGTMVLAFLWSAVLELWWAEGRPPLRWAPPAGWDAEQRAAAEREADAFYTDGVRRLPASLTTRILPSMALVLTGGWAAGLFTAFGADEPWMLAIPGAFTALAAGCLASTAAFAVPGVLMLPVARRAAAPVPTEPSKR